MDEFEECGFCCVYGGLYIFKYLVLIIRGYCEYCVEIKQCQEQVVVNEIEVIFINDNNLDDNMIYLVVGGIDLVNGNIDLKFKGK